MPDTPHNFTNSGDGITANIPLRQGCVLIFHGGWDIYHFFSWGSCANIPFLIGRLKLFSGGGPYIYFSLVIGHVLTFSGGDMC